MEPAKSWPDHAINLCQIPPWTLACRDFPAMGLRVELCGVRSSNRHLFTKLDSIEDPTERGELFHDYLDVKFSLHHWNEFDGNARRSLRNSYIRYLRGWGVDSNGVEGAVLKAWVESRFGIAPTYHRGILRHESGEEDMRFALDRMKGLSYTNAIDSQIDLLYEFCQYELHRRNPGITSLTLFRGTNDADEHPILDQLSKRNWCVRLNNLCSFTSDREKAWEFGSTVWRVQVPSSKILFFSSLLPSSILRGEDEYLVIGGEYWTEEIIY